METGKTTSGMEILRNNIFFDKSGYYRGPGIIWHGEMAKQGIADLLPYDYKPSAKGMTTLITILEYVDTLATEYFRQPGLGINGESIFTYRS